MKEKPYFSLFAPAVRSNFYEDAYSSAAANNDIPFEMVFVGNVPPTKTMPDNFRYIYSEGTPSNCWEIAARASEAELLILTADDLRYSKNFLNRSYYYTKLFDLDKTLVSFRFCDKLSESKYGLSMDGGLFFDQKVLTSPALGLSGLFRKDLWLQLGGLDRRFYGAFADIDMTLRFHYELGMNIFIVPDCIQFEVNCISDDQEEYRDCMLQRFNPRSLLDSLWVKDGVFFKKRLLPVESF